MSAWLLLVFAGAPVLLVHRLLVATARPCRPLSLCQRLAGALERGEVTFIEVSR